jgi:hypothetical protein
MRTETRGRSALLCLSLLIGGCVTEPAPQARPTGTTAAPSPSPSPTPSPSATPAPRFSVEISPVTREELGASWRPGCPVPPSALRSMRIRHWGFDGATHEGELVVHRDAVSDLSVVFRRLFALRFPIERMEPVDAYGADDDRSMAANNTSAFNCRRVTDNPRRWSRHAYGRAIDINPVQNPYVVSRRDVRPPAGRAYTDRSDVRPGMIVRGDAVVRAFAAVGWSWGGNFRSAHDPQHFADGGG